MERYSHKDILNEGISNLLRKGIAGAARVAAAAGGAVKAGAQQGAKADIVSLGRGARQGYRDEARKQRRLKKRPKPKSKPKTKEHFSDNVKKALSNIKDEKPVKKDDPLTGGIKESPISDDKTNRILKLLKGGVEKLPAAAESSYKALRRLAIDGYKTGKYAANEIVSAANGFLTAIDEFQQGYDEGSKDDESEVKFKPKVGDEVLVRTKKVPTGEPGVVKRLNPGGRITVSTAGNKTGYAFNPKNVIPSPRVKNESISQINLLRQLTLLS